MMQMNRLLTLLLAVLSIYAPIARAEDSTDDVNDYQNGNDYIKYWTEYAILPKRCIV
jgi:hypothetical protein